MLSRGLRFLLPLDGGLFVALTLPDFLLDTGLRAISLKAAKSIVQGLVLLHDDCRHSVFTSVPMQKCNEVFITQIPQKVKTKLQFFSQKKEVRFYLHSRSFLLDQTGGLW